MANEIAQQQTGHSLAETENLLRSAVGSGASDLHLQPELDCYRMLLRRDGELQPWDEMTRERATRTLAQLKILSRLPVYRRDIPQEGRLSLNSDDGKRVLARVAFLPTIHGEKAVVRFFSHANPEMLNLESLGLPPEAVEHLFQWITKKQGLILLTGPSGSGKTTTIYSLLHEIYNLNAGKINLTTLEEPVECDLGFASQTQVNPDQDLTFATGLRTLLRQDPDVIALGEIRDRETAEIAIRAALTGHLVISTLHTAHTIEVPIRLLQMGIEPYLVASTLLGAVSLRLFRSTCSDCEGKGCELCDGRGWSGRRALGECLVPDSAFYDLLLRHPPVHQLREEAHAHLKITLEQDGERRIANGQASREEITRVLGRLSS
jgi:general secretion pathway protein E